jgi:hypothetical protein
MRRVKPADMLTGWRVDAIVTVILHGFVAEPEISQCQAAQASRPKRNKTRNNRQLGIFVAVDFLIGYLRLCVESTVSTD